MKRVVGIVIEEDVWKETKKKAVDNEETASALVERAIRREIAYEGVTA